VIFFYLKIKLLKIFKKFWRGDNKQVPFRSLGLLNYIRICHDNFGQCSSVSWFLKYLIIRDLQTMKKFHFISQKWFAVEKDNGKVIF
jgi:hypothetical protein